MRQKQEAVTMPINPNVGTTWIQIQMPTLLSSFGWRLKKYTNGLYRRNIENETHLATTHSHLYHICMRWRCYICKVIWISHLYRSRKCSSLSTIQLPPQTHSHMKVQWNVYPKHRKSWPSPSWWLVIYICIHMVWVKMAKPAFCLVGDFSHVLFTCDSLCRF